MIRLRRADARDAPAIAELYLASHRRHVAFAPLAHPDDEVRAWVGEHLVPSNHVVVAEDGDRIVGFTATSIDDGAARIGHLYVDADRVGGGIGAALLDEALARLPRPVQLWTFAENAGARRFYERHGFVAVEFGDGSGNAEGAPDVRYALR